MELTQEQRQQVYNHALEMMSQRGIRGLKMDELASRMGMSKRTIYEIFSSKKDVILGALDYFLSKEIEQHKMLYESSDNVMEAVMRVYIHHRELMSVINIKFFQDLGEMYPEVRAHYQNKNVERNHQMQLMLECGIRQGVFRDDFNVAVQAKILDVQIEALKRIEHVFPSYISEAEIYDQVTIGFLRSIASPKGMLILDDILKKRENEKTKQDS